MGRLPYSRASKKKGTDIASAIGGRLCRSWSDEVPRISARAREWRVGRPG